MLLSMDSLTIYRRLKSSKMPEKAAKEVADILTSIRDNELATKADLETARQALKNDVEIVKAQLQTEIEKSKNALIMWIAGLMAAQTAATVTLIKLLR